MTNEEIGRLVLTLAVLVASVHGMGFLFQRMRQPRLVGEILAGVVLGPCVLGRWFPEFSTALFGSAGDKTQVVLGFIYWLGLLLLMFVSGSQTRHLLGNENRRETVLLVAIGTPIPFFVILILGLQGWIPLHSLTGEAGQPTSALLVLAIAVAVTSIPVISRIFYDLGILHTRFASLLLGSAVIEDVILWAVLAVATSTTAASSTTATQLIIGSVTAHMTPTLAFTFCGLTIAPIVLRHFQKWRLNYLVHSSPIAYIIVILLGYAALAAALGVTPVFAAFLAGVGVVGGIRGVERPRFAESLHAIAKFASAFFIPVYFAFVGYRLDLGKGFSAPMFLAFLAGSSLLALIGVGAGAWVAGFRGLDVVNLAVATNARGGPGIVLATVAFEARIINVQFYTTLVLTAIVTSQIAGAWLSYVLRRGWPLLSANPEDKPIPTEDGFSHSTQGVPEGPWEAEIQV
jgi:Kef-type K+ transport system membrane component KefB